MSDQWLEYFWGEILSRDTQRIQATFASIEAADERQAILAHLCKMATEAGWAEPQRVSAQAALDALNHACG
ncbi:MAG: hypothetical protein H6673_10430 [Anaerolineales bacterium]|nr:hypothetical protein [Anaerolineales bacterium]